MALYTPKYKSTMDKFKQILVSLFICILFTACADQSNKIYQNETVNAQNGVKPINSEFETIHFNNDYLLELHKQRKDLEAISTYNDIDSTVSFCFVETQIEWIIDPMLELSIFINDSLVCINNMILDIKSLSEDSIYKVLFSCKKQDTLRVFRKQNLNGITWFSSGRVAIIFYEINSDKTDNIIILNELVNKIVKVFYKRRDELSYLYKGVSFNELKYLEQQEINEIIPIRIWIMPIMIGELSPLKH